MFRTFVSFRRHYISAGIWRDLTTVATLIWLLVASRDCSTLQRTSEPVCARQGRKQLAVLERPIRQASHDVLRLQAQAGSDRTDVVCSHYPRKRYTVAITYIYINGLDLCRWDYTRGTQYTERRGVDLGLCNCVPSV